MSRRSGAETALSSVPRPIYHELPFIHAQIYIYMHEYILCPRLLQLTNTITCAPPDHQAGTLNLLSVPFAVASLFASFLFLAVGEVYS